MVHDDYSRFIVKCSLEIVASSRGENPPHIYLSQLMPYIKNSYKNKELIYTRDNGNISIAISDFKETDNEYIILWEMSNKRASDPHFNDIKKGTRRKETKKGEEGLGCTAHMIIKKEPIDKNGAYHFLIIEEVVGFGLFYIGNAFNFIGKQFSEQFKYIDNKTKRSYMCYPKIELSKFASNKLGDVLSNGFLTGVTLVNTICSEELDSPLIKKKEESLKLVLSKSMGQKALAFLVNLFNKNKDKYPIMKVTVRDRNGREVTQNIDEIPHDEITIEELANTPIIEREKAILTEKIDLCQSQIHNILVDKSTGILYK